MAFEYNGFIHRDLEPQVRYDAEQVQLLKQADVTINESLQTVNTEINGKLNKPTNPSAESAVTMLADGTVGTKPLSEIGGGKLYRHDLVLSFNDGEIHTKIMNSNNDIITLSNFNVYTGYQDNIGYIVLHNVGQHGIIRVYLQQTGETEYTALVDGCIVGSGGNVTNLSPGEYIVTNIEDYITEV